jgi:hypothetical protein
MVSTSGATKEVVRRLLATTTSPSFALHAVCSRVSHPVGVLKIPPLSLPARGMEIAMQAFVKAGIAMGEGTTYERAVRSAFEVDAEATKSRSKASADSTSFDPTWLGRGTACVQRQVSLVSTASNLFSACFKVSFVPFWAHCMSKKMRLTRLDAVQYEALHSNNACTNLALALPEKEALAVQRLALNHPCAGLLSVAEVEQLLGCAPSSDLMAASPKTLAKLLVFARVAWVSEALLFANLGERTRRMQENALLKRHAGAALQLKDVPKQAYSIFACTECKRVANAFCSDTLKANYGFSEIGISSCMQCATQNSLEIRCAKRASAALRLAVSFEEDMSARLIEEDDIDTAASLAAISPVGTSSTDPGVSARVRRDARCALEQRKTPIACGDEALLQVPLLGRAVRLWQNWYALCAYCASVVQITPQMRFAGEICCLHCDLETMGVSRTIEEQQDEEKERQQRRLICRFCGKIASDAERSCWRSIKAPLDRAGHNFSLPPPLRSVCYCPTHTKQWLAAAHRVLETRVVLSHLAFGAKPLFGADRGTQFGPGELGFENGSRAKKRKRKRFAKP